MSEIVVVITGATGPAGTATVALDDLTDVVITAAASGDIIRHNGTNWVDAVGTTHFEAAGAVATHEADSTSVHGIADTSALVTTARTISTTTPLAGGGALSGNLTLSVGAASDTASGVVELATTAETTTGTDIVRAVTPAGLLNATTASNINARVAVKKAGTLTAARRGINFIEGTNVTITTADDAGNEEVDVTITAAGGDITTATAWAAKGDLIAATGNDAAAIVTVGSNGRSLLADSAQSAGVRWGAANPGPHTGYTTGSYYTPGRSGVANTTASWGLNQLWFVPFFVTTTTTFDQMQVYQSATGNTRLGIYAADATNGAPGTLVLDAGVITGVGGGDKTLSISQSLTGGTWYYLALVSDTTLTFGTIAAASLHPITSLSPATGTVNYAYFRTFTYGALPAPAGSLSVTTSAPCILLRAA